MSDKPQEYSLTSMSDKEKVAEITADSRNHMHEAIDENDTVILYVMDAEGNYRILNFGDLTHQALLMQQCTMRLAQAVREASQAQAEAENTSQQ